MFPSPRANYPGTGFLPPMISYAQNFEDVTLRRGLKDIEKGFYIDVGANHPVHDSVTKWFYDAGWRGVNVEPVPSLFERLKKDRPWDVNIASAVGGSAQGVVTFHAFGETGLGTLRGDLAKEIGRSDGSTIEVPMTTLDWIIAAHATGVEVDFLKIDVEGAEPEVLSGLDLSKNRPRIIVAENTGADTYEGRLLQNGYIFAWFDCLNRFYVRQEDEWRCDLIARPPSVWDNVTALARTGIEVGWVRSRLARGFRQLPFCR